MPTTGSSWSNCAGGIRFHALLAPNAKLLSRVVPQGLVQPDEAIQAAAAGECVVEAETVQGLPNVLRGVNTLHRVVPVKGPKERIVTIFAFFDRAQAST